MEGINIGDPVSHHGLRGTVMSFYENIQQPGVKKARIRFDPADGSLPSYRGFLLEDVKIMKKAASGGGKKKQQRGSRKTNRGGGGKSSKTKRRNRKKGGSKKRRDRKKGGSKTLKKSRKR